MIVHTALVVLGLTQCHTVFAGNAGDWRQRTIYQVMTDRFALTDGSTTKTCDTSQDNGVYCGGTWQGLTNKLDYIQGMGFDAVWISPITKQLEGNTPDGSAYHGYWQTDITQVNEQFGSADDLKSLAAELHSRNMYLMVDVVVNHFAWYGSPDSVDYGSFTPFNSQDQYHSFCSIDYGNTADMTQIEQCWMGDTTVPLPDLRTEDPDVSATWNDWINGIVSSYSIDGLRIDSVMEVNTDFWSEFQSAAGVYSLGEVYNGDNSFVCSYQNYIPGVFNYAMYFTLIDVFKSTSGSIPNLVDMISSVKNDCSDPSTLGTFSENHDQPRFAALNGDMSLAKNVIAFTMLTDGIPVIYQGQEQHYNALGGESVPYNREALWLSGYNTDADLYQLLTHLNAARKNAMSDDPTYLTSANTVIWQGANDLAMRKGNMITVLTNRGSNYADYTLDIPTGLAASTPMTEILTCDESLSTSADGTLVVPMSAGVPRVYYPTASLNTLNGPCAGRSGKRTRSRLFRS